MGKKYGFILFLFSFSISLFANEVKIYQTPKEVKQSKDYKIKINGMKNFVYDSQVAAFTYFSFEGKINVEVETTFDVKWVDIRPISKNISFSYTNHLIKFTLDKPVNLSLELNGESSRPLYIFANPPEKEIPDSTNPNVLYFRKGKIYNKGVIKLKSNQTVYVEGGAVLQCAMVAEEVEDINILGRGIIDGSIWKYNRQQSNYVKQKMMVFKNSKNINIKGVVIVDSPGWTMKFKDCNNIKIDNIKHVNWKYGSDGIDLVSTSDVSIKNSFLRDNDDNITIKSWGGKLKYSDEQIVGSDVKNILVENCVLWNMTWGNALEIGFELRCEKVSDIIFRNIDIIHVERSAAISIHNGDYATVENILYENINIEDAQHKLIDFGVFISQYSTDREQNEEERTKRYLHGAWDGVQDVKYYGKKKHAKYRGKIRNIIFKNIKVVGGKIPFSLMVGYNDEHNIENVTFENLEFYGKKITNVKDAKLYLEYADNIKFK